LSVCKSAGGVEPTPRLIDRVDVDPAGLVALLSRPGTGPQQKLSTSLVRGLLVLSILPRSGETVGIVELARRLEMSASTAHRYLQTLMIAGLARRDEQTREYGLELAGSFASSQP
jgi:hypothetical protein